jgi:nitrate/nitrite-specific signal transduction histidine kinase
MRKRASALNGQLEIISTPGQGAKIELRFPFQSSSRKRNLLQGA